MAEIAHLDVSDDAGVRAFWDVEQAAQRADRAHPVPWTWDRPVRMVRPSAPGGRPVELVHEMQRKDADA